MVFILSGCNLLPTKTVLVQVPFTGFVIYEKPKEIHLPVYKTCYGTNINDIVVNLGDCVSVDNLENLIIKTKTLEKIVENYEKDINAYLRLVKGQYESSK